MNISAKHTAGPWSVWKAQKSLDPVDRENWAILSSENRIIAEAFWKVETDEYMPVEANARLIAAAPELLEAAELGLQIAEAHIHDEYDGTAALPSILVHLEPIRAAIKKARGT